jgi:hypothetical protein
LALKGSSTETAASPLEPLIGKMVPGGVLYMGKVLVLELFWFARSSKFPDFEEKMGLGVYVRKGLVGDFSEAKKIFSTLPSRSKKFSYCPNDLSNDSQGQTYMLYDRTSLEKHPEKKNLRKILFILSKIPTNQKPRLVRRKRDRWH